MNEFFGNDSFLSSLLKNYVQVVCTLFASLNIFSDGMHYAWSAPTTPVLEREDTPIELQSQDDELIQMVYLISGIFSLPVIICLADKIGRQATIVVSSSLGLVAWLLIGIGNRVEYVLVARCLAGASASGGFVATPIYIAEIAHQRIRGFLLGVISTMGMLGILVMYVIGPNVSVRVPPMVGGLSVIIQLVVLPFLPGSPYYYLYTSKEEEAIQYLRKLRGSNDVNVEIKAMSAAITRQKSEPARPLDLIKVHSYRKAMLLLTIFQAFQNIAGFPVVVMNFHGILNDAGIFEDSYICGLIFAAVMLIASIIFIFIADIFNRKLLFSITSYVCGFCMLVVAVYFQHKTPKSKVESVSRIPFIFIVIYGAFFKLGPNVLPTVMSAELFPAKLKTLGVSVVQGMFLIFASVSVYLFHIIRDNYGMYASFYMFAFTCFGSILFVVILIPETRGKTLEQIQIMMKLI